MQAVSDEQLIQWVSAGDASCLDTLFERHHRTVFRYCYQFTHSHALSEDLVQDVFMKLLKNANSYRGTGSFKAWMFSIAHNVTFDHLRKLKSRHDIYSNDEIDDEEEHNPISSEHIVANKQDLDKVIKALEVMPAEAREVIWLGRFVFNSYQELGEALGCTAGAARVRMHRAMQLLNTALSNMGGVSAYVKA